MKNDSLSSSSFLWSTSKITATHTPTQNEQFIWESAKGKFLKKMKNVEQKGTRWKWKRIEKWTNGRCVHTWLCSCESMRSGKRAQSWTFFVPLPSHERMRNAFLSQTFWKIERWTILWVSTANCSVCGIEFYQCAVEHTVIVWCKNYSILAFVNSIFIFCSFVRRMLEFPNGKIQFDSHLISPLKPTRMQRIRMAVGSATTIGRWQTPMWITVLHLMHSTDFKLIWAAACVFLLCSIFHRQTFHSCQTGQFACVILI